MESELGNEFINADGIMNYEVASGIQNIGNQYNENFMSANGDSDEYYDADGESYYGGDDFYDAKGDNDDFYNAGGLFSGFRKAQAKREKRRMLREKSKSEARVQKAKAKVGLADAQKESAKQMGKGSEADLELAKSLGKNAEQPNEKGLSKGMKIGIAVGVVLILGVVGFIVYKKMGAKKLGK
jgi:preprotein translocase subunit Sss1